MKLLPAVCFALFALASARSAAVSDYSQPYRFTVFAGELSVGAADGKNAQARFYQPHGVAVDAAGNIYVADSANHTIRVISPAGTTKTLAGKAGEPGQADGTGAAARFWGPRSIALDKEGNLFVADYYNHAIRKVTPKGKVTTWAGKPGERGYINAVGAAARFAHPTGLAIAQDGAIFVADAGNAVVRRISPGRRVSVYAGAVTQWGYEDGPARSARFGQLNGICIGMDGSLYVTDQSMIRKISSEGVVSTFARRDSNEMFQPTSLAIDRDGSFYVSDQGARVIHRVSPSGEMKRVAGMPFTSGATDGPSSKSSFWSPQSIALASDGTIYVADAGGNTIRRITNAQEVSTVAGRASMGSEEGAAGVARFSGPTGIARDADGNFYVTDSGNHTIRRITPKGKVKIVYGKPGRAGATDATGGAARFNNPRGIVIDSKGVIYVADTGNRTIRKITPDRVVTTLAGNTNGFLPVDGKGSAASFYAPTGLTIWNGALFVTDGWVIRKVTFDGDVTTVAGGEWPTGSNDGRGREAGFSGPDGIAVDNTGTLLVADEWSGRIRAIDSMFNVTTIIGQYSPFGVDDGPAAEASMGFPKALASDGKGNMVIVQGTQPRVRQLDANGAVRTLAGNDVAPSPGVGGYMAFGSLSGVCVAPDGTIFAVDSGLNTIWKGVPVANTAPTLNPVEKQKIKEDRTLRLPLSVNDTATPQNHLRLSAKSSNSSLLRDSAIKFSWVNNGWELTAKPRKDAHGTATITLSVSDGARSVSKKFKLTVTAVNDAPQLGPIESMTVARSGKSKKVKLQISDPDVGDTLTLTATSSKEKLIPLSGIILEGSGANRTLTIKPTKNKTGKAKVTLILSDGKTSVSQTFSVQVVDS